VHEAGEGRKEEKEEAMLKDIIQLASSSGEAVGELSGQNSALVTI
jgi:hypothetical protein